ncbi:MAG: hypothetical protein RR248_05655 [Clostridia bacterium]
MLSLLYLIGELLMLEVEEIKNVTYPKCETPTHLLIEMVEGINYKLELSKLN